MYIFLFAHPPPRGKNMSFHWVWGENEEKRKKMGREGEKGREKGEDESDKRKRYVKSGKRDGRRGKREGKREEKK